MAKITERFSDRSMRRTPNGRVAMRGFDVTGVATANDALDALAAIKGIRYNSFHPQNLNRPLRVARLESDAIHPQWFRVEVRYTEPDGSDQPPTDGDPLAEPASLRFTVSQVERRVDSDANGNPIVNSARVPFRTSPTDLFPDYRLIVERNEPFFDFQLAVSLNLSVNADSLVVEGRTIARPGEARLMAMRPTREFRFTDTFVPVRYEFSLRDRDNVPDGVSPHAIRIADIGFQARATKADRGLPLHHLYETDPNGTPIKPIATEAKLDGGGAPLDDSLAVGENDLTAASLAPPAGATVQETDDAVFLWYAGPNLQRQEFSRLGLD